MAKIYKTRCRREGARVCVKCPECGVEQELILSDEDYQVNMKGHVFPDWVCMARPSGHYTCFKYWELRIVNW